MKLPPLESLVSHDIARTAGDIFTGVCRICGPTRFRSFATKNTFHLGRCEQCEAVQITSDLSEASLEDYYDKKFFDITYRHLLKDGIGRRKEYAKFTYRMDEIEKVQPQKGKILDVGCSFGFFCDVARDRGWQPVGIDIGEHAVKFARDELGLEVYVSDLHNAPTACGDVDVVTLWNVVEHLDEPIAEFRRINALLKPGGTVVFTTGDLGSYLARLQGLKWRMFIPPIHVVNYNMKAIAKLLDQTGFSLETRSVALPREALLKRMHLIGIFKALRFSDKMMIFARKEVDGTTVAPSSDGP
jgi:2-polyprenyl-3-methyl-5-hydroxy-6-metoxy-1,4-benzoquinol methylase